jgi:hypothetical protein
MAFNARHKEPCSTTLCKLSGFIDQRSFCWRMSKTLSAMTKVIHSGSSVRHSKNNLAIQSTIELSTESSGCHSIGRGFSLSGSGRAIPSILMPCVSPMLPTSQNCRRSCIRRTDQRWTSHLSSLTAKWLINTP